MKQGLDALDALIHNLEQIEIMMPLIVIEQSDKVLDLMADLNRDQLRRGERPDGSLIDPPYKPYTVKQKLAKGQPTNKVTLFDEGNFYARLKGKKWETYIEMTSDDPKTEKLLDKYGEVFGLSDIHMEMIREELLPYLLSDIKQNYL